MITITINNSNNDTTTTNNNDNNNSNTNNNNDDNSNDNHDNHSAMDSTHDNRSRNFIWKCLRVWEANKLSVAGADGSLTVTFE